MGVEIERKFLVSEPPPWLGECPSEEIEQGYLAVGTDHEVRLRRSGGERVHKRRHRVEGEPTLEVDLYLDALEGLATAEAEFPSVPASREFDPPDWLGRELTEEPGYANQQLALHGVPG
jgi:CYTH domain-containing protein